MTMVPAMEAESGTIGSSSSLIKRSVRASTTCLAFSPPSQTTTTTTGEPAAAGFALRLTCHVTMYIRAGHGQEVVRTYRCGSSGGGGAEASRVAVPGDEDGVRDALRGMLRSIRPLQDLGLTDGEWESIVPQDVVAQFADPLARARHGGAEVDLAVVQRVRFDPARVLMAGCKEIVGVGGDGGEAECSVCFDALRGTAAAVELPGCAHAFHRRCISRWFSQKPTCPLCRGDVVKHLHPELQKHIADFSNDAM